MTQITRRRLLASAGVGAAAAGLGGGGLLAGHRLGRTAGTSRSQGTPRNPRATRRRNA